jgi:class 3 adenylate cyclase
MLNEDIESKQSLRPIADLYPETTVLFADIKVFTFWSGKRTPTEVFTLLEALYGEFDKCARARRVFKVETIKTCKNHALVMVRFALDMLAKTIHVVQNLSSSLGEETLELALRVGMNSGATTAGVLRGERARFQLFGDTVNTASRMESHGMAGWTYSLFTSNS